MLSSRYALQGGVWGPASGQDSLYWNELGINQPSTFIAHYPQQEVTDPVNQTFTVQTDQHEGSYQLSDLLHASTTAKGEAVDLHFQHLMSRIVVQVMDDKIASASIMPWSVGGEEALSTRGYVGVKTLQDLKPLVINKQKVMRSKEQFVFLSQ